MAWLFVIGVALEIAGAMLVASALLLPIVLRQWAQLAARGYLFPRGGPRVEDMLEPAYAAIGAVLLVAGFATQLAGYVVEFARGVLLVAAIVIAFGAFVTGLALARYVVAPALLRKAEANDPTQGRPGRHGAL